MTGCLSYLSFDHKVIFSTIFTPAERIPDDTMESIRIPYKNDVYGNAIFARLAWSADVPGTKPIGKIVSLTSKTLVINDHLQP